MEPMKLKRPAVLSCGLWCQAEVRLVQHSAVKHAVQQYNTEGDGFVIGTEPKSLFLHQYREDWDLIPVEDHVWFL